MLDAITLDPATRTIRATTDEADDYFGLSPMTNGTAATCRRTLVQPEGFRWVRSCGRPATGFNYVFPDQVTDG